MKKFRTEAVSIHPKANGVVTRYRTCSRSGEVFDWVRLTETGQPDLRMFWMEGSWYFPATEYRGCFGLYAQTAPVKRDVPPAHRQLCRAVDRAGMVQAMWMVDLEGLFMLLKDAAPGQRLIFERRLRQDVLPLVAQEARRQADLCRRLAAANRQLQAEVTALRARLETSLSTSERLRIFEPLYAWALDALSRQPSPKADTRPEAAPCSTI